MAQNTFNDGTSGDVVIRSGPPASSGGSGGGFGGGGGVSGGFGGTSKKKQKARKRALAAHRQAQANQQAEAAARAQADAAQAQAAEARAQEQAHHQALLQFLESLAQRHNVIRAAVDSRFAEQTRQLSPLLEQEIVASRRRPTANTSERWQLHTITLQKNEIDGLIARKTADLNAKNTLARSFDGHDPLTRNANDYLTRLGQFGQALNDGHQIWEAAYNAAHEARLLASQIDVLRGKSAALARHHAEQTVFWREREAIWEAQRKFVEQREARVRFKQQVDEDARLSQLKQANTFAVPMAPGATFLTHAEAWVADVSTKLLEKVVQKAVSRLSLTALVPRPTTVLIAGMVYSPALGNAELTPEQRRRLLQSVAVPAQTLGLSDERALRSIADSGGSVEMPYRLKTENVPDGTAVIVVATCNDIGTQVPVINAVLDPLTGNYTAQVPGSPTRYLQFTADTPVSQSASSPARVAVLPPLTQNLPKGADLRIQDCIICLPGSAPIYLSFSPPPLGSGIVTGTGQIATADWWKHSTGTTGVAIPTQIGDQLRGREITSFRAFDQTLWRTLGEQPALTEQFDEVNKKRVEKGFAPYAPKSAWVGERREFELRFQENAEIGANPFNLDKISIATPQSAHGRRGVMPSVQPWPVPPVGIGTWTPLVPPGAEQLGSTTTPIAPSTPVVYPGQPVIPILPANETFPAVDEGQVGASIPGFPADMELPSPDALFLDRRDDPGVATGIGSVASNDWQRSWTAKELPIPSRIADLLRGREFSNFHGFRRAFWRAVAADLVLSRRFTPIDLQLMKKGNAPFASANDRNGGRVKLEIHHLEEVAKGGAVYDMDNLIVLPPRQHIDLHRKGS